MFFVYVSNLEFSNFEFYKDYFSNFNISNPDFSNFKIYKGYFSNLGISNVNYIFKIIVDFVMSFQERVYPFSVSLCSLRKVPICFGTCAKKPPWRHVV